MVYSAATWRARHDVRHQMVRQDRRAVIHYGPDGEALCVVGRRKDVDVPVSSDPRKTTCGQCHRLPEWKQAWKDAAKKVSAP